MKKLLTFLGTTNYVSVNYYLDKEKVNSIRFVQEALAKILCKNWQGKDKIIVFLTKSAEEKNWKDDFFKDDKGNSLPGLRKTLSKLNLKVKIEGIDIPEGKSEKELWELFKKIFYAIDREDEIYVDITHSFRSLPLLIMIALDYAVNIKNAKINGVYYGALESLGTPREVKEMGKEERNVSIFNLTPFISLFEGTIATKRFTDTGDASLLQILVREKLESLLRKTKGESGRNLVNFVDLLYKLSSSFATCRQREIPEIANKLKNNFEKVKQETSLFPMFVPLIESLQEKLKKFREFRNFILVAEWCLEHNLLQQGFTLLEEGIITYYVSDLSKNLYDRYIRKTVTNALNCKGRGEKETEELKKFPDKDKLFSIISPEVAKIFVQLSEYRNDLNHAGWTHNIHKAEKFRQKLKEFIDEMKEVQDVS